MTKEYRGFTITREEATQLGPRTSRDTLGFKTHRKIKGWLVSHPEHLPNGRWCDTLKDCHKYIDDFLT